jgi:hypothetical protein
MKIAHRPTVASLAVAWCCCVLWLWPRAVRAGTLSTEVKAYDWASLGYACALGLLGGVLALIVALATDRRVVLEVLTEGGRNAIVSPIAGGAAYLLLEALAGLDWLHAPTMVRFLVIVGSGWAGIAFFLWTREVAGKGATKFGEWLVARGTP